MIQKFRKKPIVIEAVQHEGNNLEEIEEFFGEHQELNIDNTGRILINTLEGEMAANLKDWIIKGINGEFYPCKPDIFEKTYESVKDSNYDDKI